MSSTLDCVVVITKVHNTETPMMFDWLINFILHAKEHFDDVFACENVNGNGGEYYMDNTRQY